jgi:hypothetical protein
MKRTIGAVLAVVVASGCAGGSGGTGGGAASGGGSGQGGGARAGGGGSGGTGGGGTAGTGGGTAGTGGGTAGTGGGTAGTGGGSGTSYSIQGTDCFDFLTATVNGASCDMQGQGDGSLTTNLPSPPGTNGLGNLCDLTQNGTAQPDTYSSLASIPSSCGSHPWTNYIEGGGGSLSSYGVLVFGGTGLPDGGPAYYRVWIPNSSSAGGVYKVDFQFAPL